MNITNAQVEQLAALIKKSEQVWNLEQINDIGTAQALALQAFQRLLGPLVEQQTNVNAALVKLLYWLSDLNQRSNQAQQHFQQVSNEFEAQLTRLEGLSTTVQTDTTLAVEALHERVRQLASTQAPLHRLMTLLNQTLRTNAELGTTLLTHLTTENMHEHHDSAPEL